MRRFGRRRDVAALQTELPLTPFLFDCLQIDGTPLIDEPQTRRLRALEDLASRLVVPRLEGPDATSAAAFLGRSVARGHEGVMAKALDAPYAAGRRGAAWLKIKPVRTLDLVVLAAEWGHGRRKGWLSNLHLGARDPVTGSFVMLGKTFKGLTDEMLAWQTERFLAIETGRDNYTVYVRPEVVVEIAFNEIQASPIYPGGLTLRFARVKRYRSDKTADGGRHDRHGPPARRRDHVERGVNRASGDTTIHASYRHARHGPDRPLLHGDAARSAQPRQGARRLLAVVGARGAVREGLGHPARRPTTWPRRSRIRTSTSSSWACPITCTKAAVRRGGQGRQGRAVHEAARARRRGSAPDPEGGGEAPASFTAISRTSSTRRRR